MGNAESSPEGGASAATSWDVIDQANAMPQTLEEWLTNEYGADLSAVTAISGVPRDVTGKFLFSRTLKSLYLPTIFALHTAETITSTLTSLSHQQQVRLRASQVWSASDPSTLAAANSLIARAHWSCSRRGTGPRSSNR